MAILVPLEKAYLLFFFSLFFAVFIHIQVLKV